MRKQVSPPPSATRREEEQHTATESSGEESAADRDKREVTPTECKFTILLVYSHEVCSLPFFLP